MNPKKVLVIMPAYNEEKVIGKTIEKVLKIKEQYKNLDICVVNDGSKDKTKQIVEKYDVKLINLAANLGIGGAMQTGYKYAFYNNYDIAIQFDSDGQHNENEILNLAEMVMNEENDMVIGTRFLEKNDYKGSLSRRVGIIYFSLLLKIFAKNKVTDPTSGFRAVNKKVIEIFSRTYPKDYPEPEVVVLLNKKKLKIKEMPVNMRIRQGGKSSITPIRSIYYMVKVSLSIVMRNLIKE